MAKCKKEVTSVFKKSIAAYLHFAQGHMDKTQGYWENVLWTNETKVELLA